MAAVDGKNVMTVCDIYHIATDLRSEFERLIIAYGPEKFSQLVPPVVQSLELLEYFTEAQHRDDAELDDLKNYVDLLQTEKRASAMLKEKYEKVKLWNYICVIKVNVPNVIIFLNCAAEKPGYGCPARCPKDNLQ